MRKCQSEIRTPWAHFSNERRKKRPDIPNPKLLYWIPSWDFLRLRLRSCQWILRCRSVFPYDFQLFLDVSVLRLVTIILFAKIGHLDLHDAGIDALPARPIDVAISKQVQKIVKLLCILASWIGGHDGSSIDDMLQRIQKTDETRVALWDFAWLSIGIPNLLGV